MSLSYFDNNQLNTVCVNVCMYIYVYIYICVHIYIYNIYIILIHFKLLMTLQKLVN